MYILKTRFKNLISRLNIPKVMIIGGIQFISLLFGLVTHINILYSYEISYFRISFRGRR